LKTLSCPFCGSSHQDIYDLYYDDLHRLVYCKCGAQAGEADDEERAIALWNTRTTFESQETPMESLPCPFCGGQEKEDYQQGKYFWVWCKCGAQGSHAANKQEAITLWNSRKAQSNTGENLMQKIIATVLLLPVLTFGSPGLAQVVVDFQSQPTPDPLLQVVKSATKDKNYSTTLRVANNAVKLFPDLAAAYFYRATALDKLGQPEEARLDFEQAKKLYLSQLKSVKISAQEKNEAWVKLGMVEQYLKLLKPQR